MCDTPIFKCMCYTFNYPVTSVLWYDKKKIRKRGIVNVECPYFIKEYNLYMDWLDLTEVKWHRRNAQRIHPKDIWPDQVEHWQVNTEYQVEISSCHSDRLKEISLEHGQIMQ